MSSATPSHSGRRLGWAGWWRRWRRRLRGRQGWVVLAWAVGALAGAMVGYQVGQPTWRAVAGVEIEPLVATAFAGPVGEGAGESHAWQMPLFDALVQRHVQALAGVTHGEAVAIQRSPVSATRIDVWAWSTDPSQARQAAAKVIAGYQQTPVFLTQDAATQRIRQMLDERAGLERQLADAQQRAAGLDRASAGRSIAQAHSEQVVQLHQLESQVQQTRAALASFEATPPALLVAPSPGALEERQERLALQSAFARRAAELPSSLRSELDLEQQLMDWQLGASLEHEPVVSVRLDGLAGQSTLTLTREQLRMLLKTLEQQQVQARVALEALAKHQRRVDAVLRQAERLKRQITLADLRLRHLAREAPVPGRAVVLDTVRVDAKPYDDPRVLQAWAGAGVGGVLLGGLALGLASVDRRLRRPDRAMLDAPESALLGAVPQVDAQQGDAALTALSIHEARALLQLCAQRDGARAFAVTSPQRGAGRTSVAVGLASSLALSGTPTLVVDCDLSGRERDGSNGQRTLDAALLELHYLNEDDTDPLLSGGREAGALSALMDGAKLTDCILPTRLAWLSVLPATGLRPDDIGRLSGPMLRRLIDEASKAFGVILFDTGPVLGSVEAMIVSGTADAVVMVVPHGQRQSLLDEAMGRLRMAGANVIGAIFNRAEASQLRVAPPVHGGPVDRPGLANTGSGIFAAAIEAQSGIGPTTQRADSPLDTKPSDEDEADPSWREDADDLLALDVGQLPDLEPDDATAPPTDAAPASEPAPRATDHPPQTMRHALDQLIDETIVLAQQDQSADAEALADPTSSKAGPKTPSPRKAKVVSPTIQAFLKPARQTSPSRQPDSAHPNKPQ